MNVSTAVLEHPTENSLLIKRSFLGPPALMWRIWTDPGHMARWFGPRHVTCEHTFSTPEVNGAWGCDVRGRDGGLHRVRGQYLELSPPHRLRSSWAWLDAEDRLGPQSEYTVEFTEEGDGTLLTLRHILMDEETAKSHGSGWMGAMEGLGDEVERVRQQ